jgi:formiminotetrahydrofolate cyclodeaminase
LKEVSEILDVIVQLMVKGTRLAISDVGVAASALRCAMESAILNIYINTKLMRDREYAQKTNMEAQRILSAGVKTCEQVYRQVSDGLMG